MSAYLFGVAGRDDGGLHRVFRRIGGVAGDDATLIKGAVALVGAAVGFAAIAAASEHDGALFFHRVPAAGKAALVVGAELAAGRIAAAKGELGRAVVFEHGGDEGGCLRWVIGVLLRVALGEEPILEIGHDPWARAR